MIAIKLLHAFLLLCACSALAEARWKVFLERFTGDNCQEDTKIERREWDEKYEKAGKCFKWDKPLPFKSVRYSSGYTIKGKSDRHGNCTITAYNAGDCTWWREMNSWSEVNKRKLTKGDGTCLGNFTYTDYAINNAPPNEVKDLNEGTAMSLSIYCIKG